MPAPAAAAGATWQRRVRRLLVFTGTATTIYLFFGYVFGRMRDAQIRAMRERKQREIIRAHFTSLMTTISTTLYALLPTLEPQLFAAYPVEATSQALQAKSGSSAGANGVGSPTDTGTTTTTTDSTPADSLLLEHPDPSGTGASAAGSTASGSGAAELGASNIEASTISGVTNISIPTVAGSVASVADSDFTASTSSEDNQPHPGESWATEFTTAGNNERIDEDMLTASTTSQPISLPPTDTSSAVPSPSSELSALHSSPPRLIARPLHSPPSPPPDPRSKKELWRDLKVQNLTRALSTAYIVPLVYLMTSSQLTILARTRYLSDVKAANAVRANQQQERAAARTPTGLLSYFSIDAMGLGEYVERGASAGASLIPRGVKEWFFGVDPAATAAAEMPETVAYREAQLEAANAEAERVFLSYSWWLLHEGWRNVAARVEGAVERVFAPLGLKREISPETWDALVKELRADVETELDADDKVRLYDFSTLVVPASPLPPTFEECPLPLTPDEYGPYLVALLTQTEEHVSSPDARLIVEKGVSAMLANLSDSLYGEGASAGAGRRFADLLPGLNHWTRGVWEGYPDGGVEVLTALPEFEAFAALVFGDWAPRQWA